MGKTPVRSATRTGRPLPAAEMMLMMPLPSVINPAIRTRRRREGAFRPPESALGLMGPSSLFLFQDPDPHVGRIGVHDHQERSADLIIGDAVNDAAHREGACPSARVGGVGRETAGEAQAGP